LDRETVTFYPQIDRSAAAFGLAFELAGLGSFKPTISPALITRLDGRIGSRALAATVHFRTTASGFIIGKLLSDEYVG
jgi:hypothetical protein